MVIFKKFGIERTGGESTGPVFLAIIQADGTVSYEGRYGTPYIGEYEGKISSYRFDCLAALAEEIRFFDLADSYSYDVIDCSFVYTYVKKGDKQKVVQNYADTGPRTLWAFEQLIDEAIRSAKWERSITCLPKRGLSKR